MACHHSCNKTFGSKLNYDYNEEIFVLKDNDYNKLKLSNFHDNSYKNTNIRLLSNSIEELKNECNLTCGNNTVILVLNIFNNIPFNDIPFSSSSLLDAILHIYFISKQTENDKKEYYQNIINYFDISVL
jgi:hypothetical protein